MAMAMVVRERASDGTTVSLSSHLLDELAQVCTHAAVMARGRLIIQGPMAEPALEPWLRVFRPRELQLRGARVGPRRPQDQPRPP